MSVVTPVVVVLQAADDATEIPMVVTATERALLERLSRYSFDLAHQGDPFSPTLTVRSAS